MHALAAIEHSSKSMKERLFTIASKAREHLPENEFPAKMYDFVKAQYDSGIPWEAARDAIYERYQVKGEDGYDVTSRNLYCNGCFAAGINFAASLVSLFYGEGDLKETLKIGVLCGWDSDNPTATWGGLLGFMLGKSGVEATFNRKFSNRFNIHRTRQNFPDNGIDTFENMAQMGQSIIDLVVKDLAAGNYDSTKDEWLIPLVRE
jgi:hypothetical protein